MERRTKHQVMEASGRFIVMITMSERGRDAGDKIPPVCRIFCISIIRLTTLARG